MREITRLLMLLRTLNEPVQYYAFQQWLWEDVMSVQQQLSDASRNLSRVLVGKSASHPQPAADWWTERMVLRDVNRLFRSVGDALAWQLFGFDRRYIIVLSRNEMAGPIYGRSGHRDELQLLTYLWQSERVFALINDLTNNIRIGDLTVFRPQRPPEWIEVKHAGGRVRHGQRERINQALATLHTGAPMPRGIALIASPVQLVTHLDRLNESFRRSRTTKVDSTAPERGWALVTTVGGVPTHDEARQLLKEAMERASQLALIGRDDATVSFNSDTHLGIDPSIAPFSIFPLRADTCAALLGTHISYHGVISAGPLAARFHRYGYSMKLAPTEKAPDRAMGRAVFTLQRRGRNWSLSSRGLNQAIYELLTVETYVDAIVNAIEDHPDQRLVGLTYANEEDTWGRQVWD